MSAGGSSSSAETTSDAFNLAMSSLEGQRWAEARRLLSGILTTEPEHAESLHLLGFIDVQDNAPESGAALILRAMTLAPGRAPHHNSLGLAWRLMGWPHASAREFRLGLSLRPDSAELHNNLATVSRDLGLIEESIKHYRRAVSLMPGVADIWYNLANALPGCARPEEIDACFRRAIDLSSNGTARAAYGRWLMTQGRWEDAETWLQEAIGDDDRDAAALNNLGVARQELGRPGGAEAAWRRALHADPNFADAHYNLGCLSHTEGRTYKAVTHHRAALAIDPLHGAARLAGCVAWLPILYRSEQEVILYRNRYMSALADLETAAGDACIRRALAPVIGASQPFFLPYQEQNDRSAQLIFGHLVTRVLAACETPVPLARRPGSGERIRVGIVSGFFRDHTIFKLFLEGWLTQLDRARFELIGFHTGSIRDRITDRAASLCDRFVHGLPSAAAWARAVAETSAHVLLYPECGIDPVAGGLAARRLAPVQCVAWGHPNTTGLPAIDYFVSSDLMEPSDADRLYTEQLVRLPGLGVHYTPDVIPTAQSFDRCRSPFHVIPGLVAGTGSGTEGNHVPLPMAGTSPATTLRAHESRISSVDITRPIPDRAAFNMSANVPVYWSGQALYKYLPRYDYIFPRIAASVGACRFVFIAFAKSTHVTSMFSERLDRAFASEGLNANQFCIILPPMPQDRYVAAVSAADIILDTPGWSGGKSTFDCLTSNPPIVTCPGPFMRARHTAAILRHIGCETTIAASLDEYISIAVRLGRDPAARAAVRAEVAARKHRAFQNTAPIRALEAFITAAVSRVAPAAETERSDDTPAGAANLAGQMCPPAGIAGTMRARSGGNPPRPAGIRVATNQSPSTGVL